MPKGYRLPDPVDPEDTACMKLYFPNAPEYVAAIWGSLGYLTQWSAWQRDDSQSAKIAASLFKQTVATSRTEYEEDRDCTYMAEPEYPEDDTGLEELADFLWATKVLIQQIDTMIAAGETYLTFRTWALSTYAVYIAETFATLWDIMDGMSQSERTAAIAAIPWQDTYDETFCYQQQICGEGTYSQRYWCWGQAVIDGLSYAASELSDDLLTAVAEGYEALKDLMGGNTVQPFSFAFHGYGAGFSFTEPVCTWVHEFDFSTGQHDWVVSQFSGQSPSANGTYEGSYYQSVYSEVIGGYPYHWCITTQFDFDEVLLTKIEFDFAMDTLTAARVARIYNTQPGTTSWSDYTPIAQGTPMGGSWVEETMTWTGSAMFDVVRCQVGQGASSVQRIYRVRFYGIGVDPWA